MGDTTSTNNVMSNCHMVEAADHEDQVVIRRGPWTLEEDTLLLNYIARHGEGRWNLLARSAGLKRNGKSCRLRWLNYLKPDIKRGNLTRQEQLLILELHSKWGNRWSKIAQHLPGRTDNEVKNYWRTRVQKQAKQLNLESNSQSFLDAVRSIWTPPPAGLLIHNMIMDPHPQTRPTSNSNSTISTLTDHFQICSSQQLPPPAPAPASNFSEILLTDKANSVIPQNPISTLHDELDNNLLTCSLVSDQSYGNPTTSIDQPTLFFSDQPHHHDHLFNNYHHQPHDHILANSTCYNYDHADMADRTPPLSTMSETIDPYCASWTNYQQQMIMPNADDQWTPPPHADHATNTLWKMDGIWQFEN